MTTTLWVGLALALLPVAAGSGWWMARRQLQTGGSPSVSDLSSTYFRGLNFLLNEEPDKAIEVFLKLAELDTDVVETHLALGNLFRRRGEVDRAIRIHQNLIARDSLSGEQRTHALLELGEDYMRAGLLDRAESLFEELIRIGAHKPSALRHLLAIYQQEKDWDQAIITADRLATATGKSMQAVIAQFHCEKAEEALADANPETAHACLEKALAVHPRCARAYMIRGRIASLAEDYRTAVRAYRRAGEQDIEYIPEILGPISRNYHALGAEDELREYLGDVLSEYHGVSPVIALARLLGEREGDAAAADFLTDQLRQRPSVRGLDHLIGLNLETSEGEARENLLILQDLTHKLLEGKSVYRCTHCGFGARSHHWQCPSCKTWDNVKPIHGVAAE